MAVQERPEDPKKKRIEIKKPSRKIAGWIFLSAERVDTH